MFYEAFTNSVTLDPEHDLIEGEAKSKPTKQRFEVKKWTAVAFWSWGKYFFRRESPIRVF